MNTPLPTKPPLGLIVSIALRLDHGLFQLAPGETPEEHENRKRMAMSDAVRAYEEISGQGFWSPERNQFYEDMFLSINPPSVATLFTMVRAKDAK